MKPHNLKETKNAQRKGRVKALFRTHLFWLEGFPHCSPSAIGEPVQHWCCPGLTDVDSPWCKITEKALVKASRAANEMQHDHPKALKKKVGAVDDWRARVDAYFLATKMVLADGDVFFLELDQRRDFILQNEEKSRPVVVALSWLYCFDDESFSIAFQFSCEHRQIIDRAFENNAYCCALLCQLAVKEPTRWPSIVRLAECLVNGLHNPLTGYDSLNSFIRLCLVQSESSDADAAAENRETVSLSVSLHAHQHGGTPPFEIQEQGAQNEPQVSALGSKTITASELKKRKEQLKNLVEPLTYAVFPVELVAKALFKRKTAHRKACLDLLFSLDLANHNQSWNAWRLQVHETIERLQRFLNYAHGKSLEHMDTLADYRSQFEHLKNVEPSYLYPEYFWRGIEYLVDDPNAMLACSDYINALSRVTEHSPVALYQHVTSLYAHAEKGKKLLKGYLQAVAKFFCWEGSERFAGPWRDIGSYWACADRSLFYHVKPKDYSRFFDIYLSLSCSLEQPLSEDDLEPLAILVKEALDDMWVMDVAKALIQRKRFHDVSALSVRIAYENKLSTSDVEKLIIAHQRMDHDLSQRDMLERSYALARKFHCSDVLFYLLHANKLKQLSLLCYQLEIIDRFEYVHVGAIHSSRERVASLVLPQQIAHEWTSLWGSIHSPERLPDEFISGQTWPAWIDDYPQSLQPLLKFACLVETNSGVKAEVAGVAVACKAWSDLEKRFAKATQSIWMRYEHLQYEVNNLTRALEQVEQSGAAEKRSVHLRTRLENYQARLNNFCAPSQEVETKLWRKLYEVTQRSYIEKKIQYIRQVFSQHWLAYFYMQNARVPNWFASDDTLELLLPVVEMDRPAQKLAKKIVLKRLGPPPWDFREHPKNGGFLERIRSTGIDVRAWLENPKSRWYCCANVSEGKSLGWYTPDTEASSEAASHAMTGQRDSHGPSSSAKHSMAKGRRIFIYVEDDPLKLFNMGGYFKTCLSPGNFNYFSVFTNIADINKKVIYAKNQKGKIVGRVLIGLNDAGGVQIFHRYAHNSDDNFAAHVLHFIEQFALQIGSVLVEVGDVPSLLTPNWYDDGSIAVGNRIPALKLGSPLQRQLAQYDPSKHEPLSVLCLAHIAPLPINELTYPLLIQLPDFASNAKLFPEIITIASAIPQLAEKELIALVKLAHRHGYAAQAYATFRDKILNYHLQQARQYDDYFEFDEDFGAILAAVHPSDALRIYHRLKGEYSYRDSKLKGMAVRALEKMGRHVQAKTLKGPAKT